jgi:hypothetical protein
MFPYLSRVRANDRATEFRSLCRQLGISGVTLHSYRYAWAERAKTVGYSVGCAALRVPTAQKLENPPPWLAFLCTVFPNSIQNNSSGRSTDARPQFIPAK